MSQALFSDPIAVSSGITYERQMILDSVKVNGGIDPNTRQKIGGDPMVTNKAMKAAVQDFLQSTNYLDDTTESNYRMIKF